MKSTMKFFKKAKLHENTTETDNVMKEYLKHLEEKIAASLVKLVRAESNHLAAGQKFWKDSKDLAEILTRLASKDLSKDGGEAAYVLAWAQFADLFRDLSTRENTLWANECTEKFIGPVSVFQKQEVTEQTKVLKKQYEKATDDYSSSLAKLDSLHKDPKKSIDVCKLYAAEKERVRFKKTYVESCNDLKSQYEDINERINYDFLDRLIDDMSAQRNAFQAMHNQFTELQGYLDDLSAWCEEEKSLFNAHQQERSSQRAMIHEQTKLDELKLFVGQFDKSLIEIARPIIRSGENSQDIIPLLLTICQANKLNVPEGIDASVGASTLSPEVALETLRNAVKNNFDAVGIALISAGQHERLVSLSEALANQEPPVVQTPQTPQSPSSDNNPH